MTENTRRIAAIATNSVLALALVLLTIFMLAAGCTDSSKENGTSNQQSSAAPQSSNHPLIGTWVSSESPGTQFIFTEDSVTYKELEYSVLLEETGKYSLDRNGNIEWSITWYSGGVTRWKGKLADDHITVEYTNSWDGTQGKDMLTRIRKTK